MRRAGSVLSLLIESRATYRARLVYLRHGAWSFDRGATNRHQRGSTTPISVFLRGLERQAGCCETKLQGAVGGREKRRNESRATYERFEAEHPRLPSNLDRQFLEPLPSGPPDRRETRESTWLAEMIHGSVPNNWR